MLREQGAGDLGSVTHDIEVKLIRRHPHIFADAVADTPAEVKSRWERIKVEQEGREGIFHDVPASFPALLQARKLQQRAASVGFDWDSAAEAFPKIAEEHGELAELFAEAAAQVPACRRIPPPDGGRRATAADPDRHDPRVAARGRRPAVRHGQRGAPAPRRTPTSPCARRRAASSVASLRPRRSPPRRAPTGLR